MDVVDRGLVTYLVGLTVAHAAFDAAPSHPVSEAVGIVIPAGLVAGFFADSVKFFDVLRFAVDIKGFGRGVLHPIGEFEAFDAGIQLDIAGPAFVVLAVELFQDAAVVAWKDGRSLPPADSGGARKTKTISLILLRIALLLV